MANATRAVLYRTAAPEHLCPAGLKALGLLRRYGFEVTDHPFTDTAAADAFKAEQAVTSTPQIFIDDQRIGGYDALRTHLGLAPAVREGVSYRPGTGAVCPGRADGGGCGATRHHPLRRGAGAAEFRRLQHVPAGAAQVP